MNRSWQSDKKENRWLEGKRLKERSQIPHKKKLDLKYKINSNSKLVGALTDLLHFVVLAKTGSLQQMRVCLFVWACSMTVGACMRVYKWAVCGQTLWADLGPRL